MRKIEEDGRIVPAEGSSLPAGSFGQKMVQLCLVLQEWVNIGQGIPVSELRLCFVTYNIDLFLNEE